MSGLPCHFLLACTMGHVAALAVNAAPMMSRDAYNGISNPIDSNRSVFKFKNQIFFKIQTKFGLKKHEKLQSWQTK